MANVLMCCTPFLIVTPQGPTEIYAIREGEIPGLFKYLMLILGWV